MSTETWNPFCFRIYADLHKAERRLIIARNKYQRARSHLAYIRRIASLMEGVGGPIENPDDASGEPSCSSLPLILDRKE
jgi:hypothetical protein